MRNVKEQVNIIIFSPPKSVELWLWKNSAASQQTNVAALPYTTDLDGDLFYHIKNSENYMNGSIQLLNLHCSC